MKWEDFPFDDLKDEGISEERIAEKKLTESCLGWADLSSYISPSLDSNEDDKYFIKYTFGEYSKNTLINDAKFALIFAPAVFKNKCDFDTDISYTSAWGSPYTEVKKEKSSNVRNYKIDSNTILLNIFDELFSSEHYHDFAVLKSGSKIIVD